MLLHWRLLEFLHDTDPYEAVEFIYKYIDVNCSNNEKELLSSLCNLLASPSKLSLKQRKSVNSILRSLETEILGKALEDNWPEYDSMQDKFIWPYVIGIQDNTVSSLIENFLVLHYKVIGVKPFLDENGKSHRCSVCDSVVSKKERYCSNCKSLIIWNDNEDTKERLGKQMLSEDTVKKILKKLAIVFTIAAILGLLVPCVKIIPTGYTGIRITMGRVDETPIRSSPTYKIPFAQDIELVNNKQQNLAHDERIWGESKDQTVVYMEGVSIAYQINPEYSVWLYSNVTDYKNNSLPANIIQSAMKASMQSLETDKVTKRDQVEPLAVEKLQTALNQKYSGNEVITIIAVNVNNIDFEEEYNKVISERQQAQVIYEKQQIDIKTQLERADADKRESEIRAEASAIEMKTKADAEAEAIKTKAKAQAEANRVLTESLSQLIIDYEKIQKWDGKLPKATGSNAIIDITEEIN